MIIISNAVYCMSPFVVPEFIALWNESGQQNIIIYLWYNFIIIIQFSLITYNQPEATVGSYNLCYNNNKQ